MAQREIQIEGEKFCCSVCLLKDAVTIPCGHNYCRSCIQSHWDENDQKKVLSCPQCRQTFILRPVLVKNNMLADFVKKTGLQAAPADHCYAGPEDVACDLCTGRKLKALKSCLVCLASYCEKHLQTHYEAAALKKHSLVEPSQKLQENICSRHDEVMKMFCRTDRLCICYLCSVDHHKGHDTVSAAAERTERQRELQRSRQQIHQRIQVRDKEVKELQDEVEAINRSAVKAVEDSELIFAQMVGLIEKRSSDVKQQIRSQHKTEVSRIERLQEKLEQEIRDLWRKDADLDQLSHTQDHIQFLQNCPSPPFLSEPTDSSSVKIRPLKHFEDVAVAVSKVREKLQNILSDEWMKLSQTVTEVDVLLSGPEPKTRSEFLKYSHKITLDANTAHRHLLLSEGDRRVSVSQKWFYSDHPDRFTKHFQVLSTESLTGRCYWEVKWSGAEVSVAVAYKNIKRTGNSKECGFGYNDKSWALAHLVSGYEFHHNNISTSVSGPQSSTVGVYLDHSAGILSFYSISETMSLLHRVQTSFTQPLHVGLRIYWFGSSAEICELKTTEVISHTVD